MVAPEESREPMVVPESLAGERVDRAVSMLTGWTRSEVQALVESGEILVGGVAVAKSRRLEVGDVVEVRGEPATPGLPEPDPRVEVVVRYEDDDLAVLAKPAGLVVHPGAGHPDGTLVNGVLARYPEVAEVGDPARPGIVHRLDRDTSGLLVIARSQAAYEGLVALLAAHDVERRYEALVWDHFDSKRGLIDAPLGRSVRHPTRMSVREGGREARTRYEVRAEFDDPEVSLLACELETGRTHQIRVHLQAVGHPVVGDPVYGGVRRALPIGRPFLHAGGLEFVHPVTGVPVSVTEPLPADLRQVLDGLGGSDGLGGADGLGGSDGLGGVDGLEPA